jgi:hypothetical protein
METTAMDKEILQRLANLNTDCEKIFAAYLKEVAKDVHSEELKSLQEQLQAIRDEQWKIFDQIDQKYALIVSKQIAA